MIAGLLFANHEIDGAGSLVATQPFAGATLIEHQARQLALAGATQIVVIAAQATPALLGAIGRIGRRLTIDRAANAAEAAAALHPLARVVMLADGIVAGEAMLAAMRGEGGDLVVVAPDDASGRFERVGGGLVWAGAARVSAARVGDVAALPPDYDPQSTLIRVAAQAGAAPVTVPITAAFPLPPGGLDGGQAAALIAGGLTARPGWFARYLVAQAARLAMHGLAARPLPAAAILGALGATGASGVAAIATGWPRAGMVLALLTSLAAPIGAALLDFRGEERARRICVAAGLLVAAVAILVLGHAVQALASGLILVGLAGLGLRAGATDRRWSGEPGAYLLIAAIATLAGVPAAGLAIAAAYAFVTLAARIETLAAFT